MYKKKTVIHRNAKGFALVAILTFGLIAVAMGVAIFPMVLSATRNESAGRQGTELLTAAEIGIDYAIKKLNDDAVATPGQPSSIDVASSLDVPSSYLGGFPNGTVKIRIKQLNQTDWNAVGIYSTLYSPALDPQYAPSGGLVMANEKYNYTYKTRVQKDYWRVLESTAKRGLLSRSVRVFLEPRFDVHANEGGGGGTGSSSTSYFKNAFFAKSKLTLAPQYGPLTISSLDGPTNGAYPLTLASNQLVELTGSSPNRIVVNGNVSVNNGAKVGTGIPSSGVATGSDFTVAGQLSTNSASSSSYTATPGDLPNLAGSPPDTVLANADLVGSPVSSPKRLGSNNTAPANTSAANEFIIPAPTPTGTNTSVLPTTLNSTTLTNGSYSTNSLSFGDGGNSAIIEANSPVQFYIQDRGSSVTSEAVSINASALTNKGSPQNLQIWYNGTRPVSIKLDANFTGAIYAPNAPITMTGNKNFTGALVGDQVTMNNNGNVFIDTSLQNLNGNSNSNGGLTYTSGGATDPLEPILHGYKAVSWQELPGSLVP